MKKDSLWIVAPILAAGIVFLLMRLYAPDANTKLYNMFNSVAPEYAPMLLAGFQDGPDEVLTTSRHIFTLNMVSLTADGQDLCVAYSVQTPTESLFGSTTDDSKSVAKIQVVESDGRLLEMAGQAGFATDAKDTVSFFICDNNFNAQSIDSLEIRIGHQDVFGGYAVFEDVRVSAENG